MLYLPFATLSLFLGLKIMAPQSARVNESRSLPATTQTGIGRDRRKLPTIPSGIILTRHHPSAKFLFLAKTHENPLCILGRIALLENGRPRRRDRRPCARAVRRGHEIAFSCRAIAEIKSASVLVSSVTVTFGDQLRFPSIAEAKSANGVRYFFVDDPELFDREQIVRGSERRLSRTMRSVLRSFAGVAIEFVQARLASRRDSLPRLAIGAGSGDASQATCARSRRALASGGPDDSQSRLPGIVSAGRLPRSGCRNALFTPNVLEFFGQVNFLKGGIYFRRLPETVSPTYAKEIQTPEYGCGLDGVIRDRADRLAGILNGVDYTVWSPEADTVHRAELFGARLSGQEGVQERPARAVQLPEDNLDRPLIGIVSRFVDQKGFDLIAEVCERLMNENVSLVALGAAARRTKALSGSGGEVSGARGRENRIRRCIGAPDRGRRGYVSDAIAL